MAGKNTLPKKLREFLETFYKAFGNITIACKAFNINRSTYYDWREKYPEFAELADQAIDRRLDMVEDMLNKKCLEGDTTALIFTLKTMGKRRGYVERHEVTGSSDEGSKPIQIEIVDSRKVEDAEGSDDKGIR